MYRTMYSSALEMLEMQRMFAAPDYKTYVGWILSKQHYGKMNREKSRR